MKKRAFTLIETIIYCALFSGLMTGAIGAVYAFLSSSESNSQQIAIIAEATFVNQKLSWITAGAADIEIVDLLTLRISRPDLGPANPLVLSFAGGHVYLKRDSATEQILSNPRLPISEVEVTVDEDWVTIFYKINNQPFNFTSNFY